MEYLNFNVIAAIIFEKIDQHIIIIVVRQDNIGQIFQKLFKILSFIYI